MPVIPKYAVQRYNEQPGQANLNREGTGLVARAIGSIGAEGAQFANELLQRRKAAEASSFANESYRIKKIEAQRKGEELFRDTDPLTGLVKSTGRSYFEEIQDWEKSRTDELAATSPTDLARDTFLNIENEAITSRLAAADTLQYSTMLNANKLQDANFAEEMSKSLLSHDEKTGVRLYDKGNDIMEEAEKMSSLKIGIYYSPEVGKAELDKNMNAVAKAGTESMLQQKNYGDFAKANGLSRMVPEQIAQFESALKAEDLLPKDDRVVFDKDGVPYAVNTKEDTYKNMLTGEMGKINKHFRDITRVSPDVINIPVEAPRDNKYYKYLTEKDITQNMWRLARALKDNKDNIRKELFDEVKNWNSALSTTSSTRLRVSNQGTAANFNSLVSKINSVDPEVVDPVDKKNLLISLYSGKEIGEFKDSSKFRNIQDSASAISAMANRIKSQVYTVGGMKQDPAFAAAVSEQSMAEASRYLEDISRKANTNMPAYLAEVDPEFIRKDRNKFLSDTDFNDYIKHVDDRISSMGVPAYNAKYFSPATLSSDSNSLRRAIENGPKDGFVGTLNWITQRKNATRHMYPNYVEELSDYGVDSQLKYIALFPDNERGQITARRALENMGISKDLAALIPQKNQEEIKSEVFKEMAVQMEGIRRQYPVDKGRANALGFYNMAINEANRIYKDTGEADSSDAAKQAVKNLIHSNFSTVHRGGTVFNMSFMEQQLYGLNDTLIKHADKYYTSKEYVTKNVDLEKTFKGISKLLDNYGYKGASREKRQEMAYKYISSNSTNLKGVFITQPHNGHMFPAFRINEDGNIISLLDSKGKPISVPLGSLSKDKNVLSQELNALGELFHFEKDVYGE